MLVITQKVWGPFELFKFCLVFKWIEKIADVSLFLMLGSVLGIFVDVVFP